MAALAVRLMRIVYRRMKPDDRAFVVNSWLRSFRRAPSAGLIAMGRWSAVMVPEIEDILDRPRVRVLVAADPTATDHVADLFGHLVWEDDEHGGLPLVYYCYVKHAYRGSGLARGLMNKAGIDPTSAFPYVCQTQAVSYLRDAGKLPHARWRPLLGRSNERNQHEREEREDRREADQA